MAGLLAIGGSVAFSGSVSRAAHEDVEFPAAIHAGACEAPGEVVLQLDNLVRLPEGSGEENRAGAPGSQVIHGLPDDSTIDLTVDDLFSADHILAVFNADGDIIACGPIGAYSYTDGDDLLFGLRSLGDSPYSGVVIVEGTGSDDEETEDAEETGTEIEVYLVNNTPAPTPEAQASPVS